MPTLEEISETATALAERTIRQSKAMDYAWMADQVAIAKGQQPHQLHDLIDRQFADVLGEMNVNSNSTAGVNPGANPAA